MQLQALGTLKVKDSISSSVMSISSKIITIESSANATVADLYAALEVDGGNAADYFEVVSPFGAIYGEKDTTAVTDSMTVVLHLDGAATQLTRLPSIESLCCVENSLMTSPGQKARGLSRFSADSFDCDFTPLLDGVPAVAGDRHVLGEVPERDAGPLLGRLHSGHLRPHHQGGPEGGGESYGESPSKCPPKSRHGPDAETPRPASFCPV